MANFRRPGVYIEESLLATPADVSDASSTAVFVGVASKGPTTAPMLINTWTEYVANFGEFETLIGPPTTTASVSARALSSNVATLTTSAPHGFTVGNTVTVSGVGTPWNGSAFTITAVTSTTFSYANATANVQYTVTTKEVTSNVAKLTFSATHTLKVGDTVVIAGVGSPFDDAQGITVTAVTSNTISWALTNDDIQSAAGTGTATLVSGPVSPVGTAVQTNPDTKVTSYLPYAVYSYLQNGGRAAYIMRAVGTSGGTAASYDLIATVDNAPVTAFTVTAKGVGTWGNDLSVLIVPQNVLGQSDPLSNKIYTLVVQQKRSDGSIVEVERFRDLTNDGLTVGTRKIDAVINDAAAGSSYIRVSAVNTAVAPDNISSPVDNNGDPVSYLDGGVDPDFPSGGSLKSAMQAAVEKVEGPLIVNAVGYKKTLLVSNVATDSYVSTTLSSSDFVAAEDVATGTVFRGDVFCINDPARPRNTGESSATYASTLSSNGDSYSALYAPWIVIQNPRLAAATIAVPPGGAVAGVMSRIDATNGPWRTPAGLIASVSNAVGVDTKFTVAEQGNLNGSNVNVIRPQTGAGICIMGGRTGKLWGADRYIGPRRTLIYLKEALRRSTQIALFENNDQRLWSSLTMTAERILRPIWLSQGLRGTSAREAYYIRCDSTLNTPAVIASGEVRMEIGVALEYPAEFIVVRLIQFERGSTAIEVQSSTL